jgi:hypothetical protein
MSYSCYCVCLRIAVSNKYCVLFGFDHDDVYSIHHYVIKSLSVTCGLLKVALNTINLNQPFYLLRIIK